MDERLKRVEDEVRDVKTTVIVLDERQQRMHEDFRSLTAALQSNTKSLQDINTLMSNRKGFIAGVITVITLLGGILAAVLGAAMDWFNGPYLLCPSAQSSRQPNFRDRTVL